MLRPYRRIGTTELHEGSIFFDIVRFTDYRAICQLAKKITRTKYHVYLELSAKRASVRRYINMHARKNSRTFIFVC